MVPDLVIAGVPIMALVVGLVEFAKTLGVPTKFAPVLAIVVGCAAGLLVQTMAVYPDIAPWVEYAVVGVVIGMAATGLYRVGSRWIDK